MGIDFKFFATIEAVTFPVEIHRAGFHSHVVQIGSVDFLFKALYASF